MQSSAPLVGPPDGTNLPVLQFPIPTTRSGPQGGIHRQQNPSWFTESGLNDIRYVDVKTGTLAAPFAVPASSQPGGIVAAYGNVYFTEYSASEVEQLDLQAARGLSATLADLGVNLYPNAINRYGTAVGFFSTGTNSSHAAFMYSGGTVKFLGKLPGDAGSYALDVNATNEAVGVSRNDTPNPGHAVLFKSGSVINLDKTEDAAATAINDAGKMWAFPAAINNNGEIVGGNCDGTSTEPKGDAFKYPPFAKVNYSARVSGSEWWTYGRK